MKISPRAIRPASRKKRALLAARGRSITIGVAWLIGSALLQKVVDILLQQRIVDAAWRQRSHLSLVKNIDGRRAVHATRFPESHILCDGRIDLSTLSRFDGANLLHIGGRKG